MHDLDVTIVGNLTDDPELRFTPSGAAVCKLTIGHNPRKWDRTAEKWVDGEPTFLSATVWRDLAENCAETLRRGMRVIARGQLRTERWEADGRGKVEAGTKQSRIVLDVAAIGPELTWATATVTKKASTRGPADDPWASASRTRPDTPTGGGNFDDEPPF